MLKRTIAIALTGAALIGLGDTSMAASRGVAGQVRIAEDADKLPSPYNPNECNGRGATATASAQHDRFPGGFNPRNGNVIGVTFTA